MGCRQLPPCAAHSLPLPARASTCPSAAFRPQALEWVFDVVSILSGYKGVLAGKRLMLARRAQKKRAAAAAAKKAE